MSIALFLLAQAASPEAAPAPSPTPSAQAQEFVIGTTTADEVIAKYGRPTFQQAMSDGTRVLAFNKSKVRVKGGTFVPIVGMFAGGAKASYQIDTFVFGADGKLKNFSITSTNVDCNTAVVGSNCK